MNKIPVQQTIVSAYGFLFAHIGAVLSIAGIPSLFFVAADYAMHVYSVSHRAAIDAHDPRATALYLTITLAGSLVMLFARAVAAVGICREAFGVGSGGIGHPLDRIVWRMFAANVGFWLGVAALVALAAAVTAVGFALAGVALDVPDPLRPTPAAFLAGMIGWFVFVYALVTILRMGVVLPAVVVAEEKGGLKRSHDLAHGNVWRLLAIAVALGFPIFLMLIAAEAAVVGSAVSPDVLQQGDFIALMQRAEDAIDQRLLPWEIYNAVVFVLYSGLFYSGAVFAYRALVPGRGSVVEKIV